MTARTAKPGSRGTRSARCWAACRTQLTQDEPQKIYEHGGLWVQRIGRLQRLHVLPEGLLIPVDAPPDGDERRAKAFHEVEGELRALGAEVTRPTDAAAIGRFARHYAS
jgi:hypothetical protein